MIDPSTRLRRAIILGDVDLVERIVRNNPDLVRNPDFTDKSNTSLHLAASHGFDAIAASLIDAGHEKDEVSRNADHETPLMMAARRGHVDVAVLLARQFPQAISYTNSAGLDALALAAQNSAATALMSLLLQHPEYPASVDVRDAEGNTPLHHASASGSLKALRILLAAGANPSATNAYDWTPLAYSQTVAAEVYFKNLIAEHERRKVEGAKQREEKERQSAAGLRMVGDEDGAETVRTPVDEDKRISDALLRHWSPVERKGQLTPGSAGGAVHTWDGRPLGHVRTRSGGGSGG